MIHKFLLATLTIAGLPLAIHAQNEDKPKPVQFRAVYHDPMRHNADLYYTDKDEKIVKLNFRPKALSEVMQTLPINGSIVLYDSPTVDPENPEASLAASVKLTEGAKKSIVVVVPGPKGEDPPYRMMLIEDSPDAFPKGESRVLPLVTVNTALQAGEHRIPLRPGKVAKVPPVKKVNQFNMAQTNFYWEQGDNWIPFTERQLQFIDATRRLFIVYATPGALYPRVTTIVDTMRPVGPAVPN